ncbi:MAG: hypothetical protein J6Y53_00800 [Alphaproteobacteria bacterium]|nr:hypothetical protein [Alphaproteobacteria bacterium]
MEQVTLHQIDSDAYVLKNKLMHRFDERYGTHLMRNDADDLSFMDIIMEPEEEDALSLYAEIKAIAGHGLTNEQKNLLYRKYPYFSNSDPEKDFDMAVGRLEKFIISTLEDEKEKVSGFTMRFNDQYGEGVLSYFRFPFSILRIQKIGREKMECMLVQNQCILVFEIV